ncbi:acyl-CoA dehydrogenase family protein [Nocardioides carbamazepini]|uniref:acyl-CoA dehydrogenase family protein n=1 Tax=Nocardioides carbamazepini TaxID=2854259 RepID=UPI002149D716|nr:acyl-CoA dehydrogenase family protein [Nocardioides carbamazepini]MCR1781350.1 acyl-CoA dehydrogenase family protein [Nocardioides carbamazepini]
MNHPVTEADVEEFRAEVRAWLAENVPAEPLPPWTEREGFDLHRAWEGRLFEGGYAAVDWPAEYGGRDAGLRRSMAFAEEYYRAGAPERINMGGLYLLGPVLMQYGTPEQCARWIPDLLACRTIWCQGFSEPGSGSDLASLRTRAERDGDHFVVNGQKIWTSMGGFADWIFALVRTDPEAGRKRKHDGITFLCIDLRSPGVEVRPLAMVDGTRGFAEVFFTDVRVPVENVVGEIDRGWAVAMSTLGFERGAVFGDHAKFSNDVADLAALVDARDLGEDTHALDELGRVLVQTEVYRANVYRLAARAEAGGELDSTASINKVFWTQMQHDIFDTGIRLLAEDGAAVGDPGSLPDADPATLRAWSQWHHRYWYARAAMIFGGTNEIQRNIISERVLGLPMEPRR